MRRGDGERRDATLGVEDEGCGGRSAFSLGLVTLRRNREEQGIQLSKRTNTYDRN